MIITKDNLFKYNELNNKNKIENNYTTFILFNYLNNLLKKNFDVYFDKEKQFQEWIINEIKQFLIGLEEYDNVIKEKQLIWQKRIDLSFNISEEYIWIELKNGIKWNAIRTLEYQINEYIEKGAIFSYIFIIIKLKKDDKQWKDKLNKYYSLINRLNNKKKVLLLIF